MSSQLLDPNKEPTPHEVQVETLARIEVAVKNELFELAHAIKHRPINAVALISRNLLELDVWANYCVLSPENAGRFYTDQARDELDAMKKLPNSFSRNPTFNFANAGEDLLKEARKQGVFELDGACQKVHLAAQALGCIETFLGANKVLSKCAHPTAWFVFAPHEKLEGMRALLHSGGIAYGEEALTCIMQFRQRIATAPQTAGSAPPPPSNSPANSHN